MIVLLSWGIVTVFTNLLPDLAAAAAISTQDLPTLFRSASSAFADNDFPRASREFREAAKLCVGSELSLQCEYFAALADWNAEASERTAKGLATWLEEAKLLEIQLKSKGSQIQSKAWNQWLECAHLVQAKWEIKRGQSEQAKKRLEKLVEQADVQESNPTETQAWPCRYKPATNTWLELGYLTLPSNPSGAARCFEKAIESCGSEPKLQAHALLGSARAYAKLSEWEKVIRETSSLSGKTNETEYQIQAKLLETYAKRKLNPVDDAASDLESLYDLAVGTDVPAQIGYEVALALMESGLADKSDALLLHLVQRYPAAPSTSEARIRLARSALEKGDWETAKRFTQESLQTGCPQDWIAYARYLYGKSLLQTEDTIGGALELELALQAKQPSIEIETAIRVDLAEALYQTQSWDKASEQLDWLIQRSQNMEKPPVWLPVVLLRQAELLANKNDWSAAEKIVSEIRTNFPECSKASEVDYLLARCRIAKADFDAARQLLEKLVVPSNEPVISADLAARSVWMIGETHMMQRRYAEALAAYEKVFGIAEQTYWHAACTLQIAVCLELVQETSIAAEWYNRVITTYASSPFAATAKERLETLSKVQKQAERVGSGKKR